MYQMLIDSMKEFYTINIVEKVKSFYTGSFSLFFAIVDAIIVIFLIYKAIKLLRNTRAWQLLKGIFMLVIIMILSAIFQLKILNSILSSVMVYGGIMLIVIFQPELRRGLEQLGTTNKIKRFFVNTKDLESKTKEMIYQVVIAATEMSKTKTGALIVIERDIKIKDIIDTGIYMNSEVSPQLLVNIFVPKTPLHDGAVVISDNKIAAASCMLPLSNDPNIARELGTRHRAAVGISKQSDAIAVVVSEESGKISVAKDGTLIADVKEDVLKKILLKNLIIQPKQENGEKEEKKEN